ncbi:MAG TPA: threonine ammonia-lyase [Candidatus Limnocylindrales bacterium]|nr:threonine ammonia-lyase [Candidatus Limnocylindrales bacterium]
MPVTVQAIREARDLLVGVARVTPVAPATYLADRVGGPVWLKCENLQVAGSFKVRGAHVRLSRLTPEQRAVGVVAASAGNHAQGVAKAARGLGIRTTVFMPVGAPLPKLAATRAYGAEIVTVGTTIDDALVAATEFSERTGAVLIHPFDHEDIVVGQGTIGLEILEQVPDVRTVLVCTGGGGLVAGIATVMGELAPDVRVIGVQAAQAAAYPASLAAGHPVALERMSTMADGIAVGRPGVVPLGIIAERHVEIRTVSEDSLSRGLLLVLERSKLLVEPAGAAGVAALLEDATGIEPPVVVVLSGGNVDPLLLARVLQHGLVAAGRYLQLRVRISDRPGGLAALLAEVAALSANVISVEHLRTTAGLSVGEVDVSLHLETRGPEHCEQVAAGLAASGFRVRPDG